MATSGTIGTTIINTDRVIEHAIRRCGLSPTSVTGETLQIAKDNLYLLLLQISNRGLNLWCVNYDYIGLEAKKATYKLPVGTLNLLEMYYARPQRVEGANSNTVSSFTTQLDNATNVIRIGVKFSLIPSSETVTFSGSDDGISFSTIKEVTKTDWEINRWYWFQLDPSVEKLYFRVSTVNPMTCIGFRLATTVFDMKIAQYNRDEYFNLPNRQILGRPSTNYYFERLLEPQVTLWPVPNTEDDHLVVVYHRKIQDIKLLTEEIEIPDRWYEAIIWNLAEILAFELPGVDPARVQIVMQMSSKNYIDASGEETDGASMRISPMIRGYNNA